MTYKRLNFFLAGLFIMASLTSCNKDDNTEEPTGNNPTAAFTVDPTSGGIQTIYNFDASASSDQETSAENLMVRWDFEGDGNWDTDYSTQKTTTHQYGSAGNFSAKLMVKDEEGNTDETSKNIEVQAGDPIAVISVDPSSGNTLTVFTFDASGSSDDETPLADLLVRWDFDGDDSWDTDYSNIKTTTHQYAETGTYEARVEVKDADENTSTASTSITIENSPPAGCPETFVDPRDGKEYAAIEIGTQCWMAENLNIGDRINGSQNATDNGSIEKYCYDDNEANCDTYGGLYQWDEMMEYTTEEGTQGICPAGWHIPTDTEWMMLEVEIGMTYEEATSTGLRGTDEGTKLKAGGTSGFEGMLAGYKNSGGVFASMGSYATFFTSTPSSNLAWSRYLFNDQSQVMRNKYDKTMGYSVRCVKDEE